MKIVVNAMQYRQNSSGIGVMLRELLVPYTKHEAKQMTILLPHDAPELKTAPHAQQIRVPCSYGQSLRRMWFQTFSMGQTYSRDAVLLVTDSKTPFFLPKSCKLVPLITDMAVYRMPEVYRPSRTLWWRLQYRYLRRKASIYLAISEFTKREIMELLHVSEERVKVIPCACPADFTVPTQAQREDARRQYGLPEHYILFVGNFNPRKNLERILQAFDLAKEQGLTQELVIVGGQGWKFRKDKALQGLTHPEAVHFIGYVPDELLPAVYAEADLFLFPTLYEGFGIPVLEAQTCGTPVLTSSTSALPEVTDGSAELVNPYSAEDICRGIQKVLTDGEYAGALVEKGYANVRRYSWEQSAQALCKIIDEVTEQ